MTELKLGKYEFYPNDNLFENYQELNDLGETKLQNGLFPTPKIEKLFNPNAEVVISNGDCVEILSKIPDETVKLIITSPPYNLGKEYEKSISLNDYLEIIRPSIEQIVRVLEGPRSNGQAGGGVTSAKVADALCAALNVTRATAGFVDLG